LYFAVPKEPAKLIFWPTIGWTSVAAVLFGIRMHKPTTPRAWRFIAAGTALFIVGDNLYTFRSQIQHSSAMFPSYVDVVYLAMYPTMIIGLALMVRCRTRRERAAVIDAAIITAAMGLLAWVILIAPYLTGSMATLARLTSIAYPMADVALLAVGVRLAVGGGTRSQSFWLLTGAIVPLIAADSLYGYLNLIGKWHEHNPIDAGWMIFYLGWGAAALHPSMVHLTERAEARSSFSVGRLVTVATAALIPPAVLLFEQAMHAVDDAVAIGVIGIVLYALVFVRIAGLARLMAETEGESRFRSLVQNASDAIIVLDDAGHVIYETPSTGRVLGASIISLEGRTFADLLHPADRQRLRRLLANPETADIAEWRIRNGSQWRYIEIVVADLREESSLKGVALTIRDSTERKKLNAELEAAVERANAASKQKSVFLANMSHEIRTPLNGLMGMLGLVRATNLDGEQRDYFDTMADSAESLAALVNDILDFSRIEAGRLDLDNHPFSLRAAVEAGLSGSTSAAKQKGLQLRAVIDDDVVDRVVGDRLRLRQILSNLASNAVKFTDQGEILVRVTNAGDMVRFSVVDSGIGIPAAVRDKLFNQYVQADTSTTRRHGGSGLGLAICKQLVQLMGGEIGVESELGQGSHFWFTIAFDAPMASIEETPREVSNASRRVLVVSALASVRVGVQELLAGHGIESTCVADAHSAMAELDETAAGGAGYYAIVVDAVPGGMDQLEFARCVRLCPSRGAIPLIGLFDGTKPQDADGGDVDVWLRKPLSSASLREAVTGERAPLPIAEVPTDVRGLLLVVEDNRVNQKVAVAILKKMGFGVEVASDGIEALEWMDRQRFDAVLMDCQMPRMDGYEATTEIRQREVGRRTPIVAMTASATSSDRDRCLEVGMDEYLTKPVDPAALDRVLTMVISGVVSQGVMT
jgi:PAS domain S-box-containing protein